MQEGQGEVIYKFGPSIRSVDIYDFYPDPNGTRIQEDMEWVVKRFRVSSSQAEYLAKVGTYDPYATREVLDSKNSKGGSSTARGERERFPNISREAPDEYGPITGFEFWGKVPWQPADGAQNRVITLLGDRVVRSRINPFIDGHIPFKEIALNPIRGRFYGLSPAEVIRYLQDSADNMLMAMNDATDLAVHVPLLVGAAFGGNPNQLRSRMPLDIIQCNNVEAVAPVPVDLSALQFAAQDLFRRKQQMREASGATNPIQSIPSGDRTTATEINQLTASASQRIELMMRVVEMDDFPWLGNVLHSRLRQYAPPQFIATLAGEQFQVNLQDIDMQADVRFVGSRHAKTPAQVNQQYNELLTILATSPELVLLYPEILLRKLRDGLGIEDAQQIVSYAQQQLAIKMMSDQMIAVVQGQAEAEGGTTSPKKAGTSPKNEAQSTQAKGSEIS
jgi:hypothetical protein